MKAFIDTNVFVAAVHSPGGVCRELLYYLAATEPQGFEPRRGTTSRRVLDEAVLVLVNKMRYTPRRAAEKIDEVASMIKLVPRSNVPAPGTHEPECWLLAEAQAGGCDHYITGDRRLLQMYAVQNVRIVTPREVMDWIFMARPIPRFDAHQDRAAYLVARLESVV